MPKNTSSARPKVGRSPNAAASEPATSAAGAGIAGAFDPFGLMGTTAQYWTDAMQRTVLFWDVMRQRANQYHEHKAMTVPHVLDFEVELVLDGHTFEKPVNYLLVRIMPPADVTIDPVKRPFVVVDPRAGHGPGVGGFKADSEIGFAMRAGHVCYFVGFTPDPVPGQTIEDVMRAEAVFLETVIDRHPEAEGKPCVIGNCQAGWAVMMLAAVRPELCGPVIVPGAPLSYWAGKIGKNPMRYLGGLVGGSWVTALGNDAEGGTFNGAHLVSNFEAANPANTFWTKNYNVWSKVDTEAERFLEFEKWWGGHVSLNAEEMQWIVDELFIGNRLATAEIVTSDGVRVDLRNIKSPIIIFCSEGDNISPPEQALGWITDLYETEDDIRACRQTIVYSVHAHIGHLGIFVSGGVARKEHQEFTANIDMIDVLPPGLYEAVLTKRTEDAPGADLAAGEWITRLEPRTLDDVRAIVQPNPADELRFAAVRRVSEINLGLYRTFLQPAVQAILGTDTFATQLLRLQPAEISYEVLSDRNPLMRQLGQLADWVRANRVPADDDSLWRSMQESMSSQIIAALDTYRDIRDQSFEQLFLGVYSQPLLQALLGLRVDGEPPRRRPGMEPEEVAFIEKRIAEIKARIAEGGQREAFIRALVYIGLAGRGVDERSFEVLNRIRAEYAPDLSLDTFKHLLREQFFTLILDQEAAVAAIPGMLPDDAAEREQLLGGVRDIVAATGEVEGLRAQRLKEIETLMGAAKRR